MASRRSRTALEVVPTADWPRVVLALAAASDQFGEALEELLEDRLSRTTDEAKQALLSMRTSGRSPYNARATIAQALEYTTDRTGGALGKREIYARAEVSGLPDGYQALPRAFDRRRFRHPVYGNTAVWVNQRGKPWFAGRFYRSARALEDEIGDLMEATVRAIGASG